MAKYLGMLGLMAAGFLPAAAMAQAAPVPEDAPPPGGVVVVSGPTAQGSSQVQATRPGYTGPTVWVYGFPVRMDAPVEPSYAGTAYTSFAGQPETGLDAIMAQQSSEQTK